MDCVARTDQILDQYPDAHRDSLIPILQEVQQVCGYLSREAIIRVGERLNLPASKIYGVATFYNQFRFTAKGEHHIQVCRGTACHVKGSAGVLDRVCRDLGIQDGETTKDGRFSIEVVSCIGACGLAPVITVDDQFHANVSEESAAKIVKRIRKQKGRTDKAAGGSK